ncbi:KinB-signaling pathway activation protein [Neobacillus terrae]|uniref:KinB-signaling pathway activation protein n=1 Tax=Neobacillus terrae TaxID=3034837 RepID=UPI00140CF810|nr:KinB-signaling pathway activation protein [Neobacillus terrae]
MTSRNWVKLFINTCLIGGLTTAIVGLIVRWNEFQPIFADIKIVEILSVLVWLIVMGILFSVISQMGFFAYLTVHRFGLGIFKSVSLWNGVQAVLIIFVLFDLVYLRFQSFAKSGDSILPYLGVAAFLLAVGLLVAWIKAKETNKEAFIPALFFMIVVTVIEWVPVLRVNEHSWFYLMLFALLVCNAYQVLILHKLNAQSDRQREELAAKSKAGGKTKKKPSI